MSLKAVKIRNTTPRGVNSPRRLSQKVVWNNGTYTGGRARLGKAGQRRRKVVRHAAIWALFCRDYHKHHGKLPPTMTQSEKVKFRNRELVRFAKARA